MSTQEASSEEKPAIVIDNGSFSIKAGFAGDDAPRSVLSNIVGKPREKSIVFGMGEKSRYIGDEAKAVKGILRLSYPMENGIVTNWDDMEAIWHDTFYNELRVKPHQQPVLLTEHPLCPKIQRETFVQIMFEIHEVPAAYVALSPLMGHYASGRNTSIVVDIGDTVCSILPITNGYTIPFAIQRYHLGGRNITESLMRLMCERGYYYQTSSDCETVREIKEKLGFVALDFDAAMKRSRESSDFEKSFELPDGKIVTLGSERFRCAESLFNPHLLSMEAPGIHEMVCNSIMKTDMDLRRMFYGNIVLSGGCTFFEGLQERLTQEVSNIIPSQMKVKVIAPPERKYSTWIGGSIVASLTTFSDHWISKHDYEEDGPQTVHRKCFY